MATHDDKGGKKPSDTPQRDKGERSGGVVHKRGDKELSEPPKKPEPTNRKVPPGHK